MRIITRNQLSNLSNRDIKWYLLDEKLWITKYYEYADVEDSIEWSIGSFNWLCEVNDTLLFNKENGRFETAIIDLSEKIVIADIDDLFLSIKKEQKGELFLKEKKNSQAIICLFHMPQNGSYMKIHINIFQHNFLHRIKNKHSSNYLDNIPLVTFKSLS